MLKKSLFLLSMLALSLLLSLRSFGQMPPHPFVIRDSNGSFTGIDHCIIKGDKKTHEFKMDTSSVDYKSLSLIDPKWIKEINIVKNEPLQGSPQTVVIILLRKGKTKLLPDSLRTKFQP